MSEADVRANAITILQQLTTYFPSSTQVNTGNYPIVDTGVSNAAVFYPGRFQNGNPVARQTTREWDLLVDIYQRMDQDTATNWTNFATFRDAIVSLLDSHPRLLPTNKASEDVGVIHVRIQADADPMWVKRDKTGIVFIWQPLRITVTQLIALTTGEYA